jgi:hypothetical protein
MENKKKEPNRNSGTETIIKMENLPDRLNNIFGWIEERITELEDRLI